MKNENDTQRGIDIIWNYVKNDFSWKKLYFEHFTKGQKFLFFLPVIFLFPPIYGTYQLFYNNSWTLFILMGLGMLFSIWWFFKQKVYFENMVSAKYYSKTGCSTIKMYHKQKMVEILGELNTKENQALWKAYFSKNMKSNRNIVGIVVIFISVFLSQYHKDYLLTFYMIGFTLLILSMTIAFVMPAFVNFKIKGAFYNQAYSLVLELEKD